MLQIRAVRETGGTSPVDHASGDGAGCSETGLDAAICRHAGRGDEVIARRLADGCIANERSGIDDLAIVGGLGQYGRTRRQG